MYTVTTTFERASPATPYYIDSQPALKIQFIDFLQLHSGLISSFVTANVTTTTQVSFATYDDEETYQEFIGFFNIAFPTFFADRDAYGSANNISTVRDAQVT